MNNNDIQVSVCIVAYNQENYIAECLNSIVTQQTNFKFEVIVGEDCSTDNTRAVIRKYIEEYPELIIPIFHEKNLGAVENLKHVYKKAKGKYIAHMDGDDTALPTKLQKQFDTLESKDDCDICSHNMKKITSSGNLKIKGLKHSEGKYDLFYLYKNLPFFAHSSKMFRNKYSPEFWNNLFSDSNILDIDIHIANLEDSFIYHVDEDLGVYRIDVGTSFNNKKVNRDLAIGAERVFEKGLEIFKDDEDKLEVIKKIYALSMLQCAYSYAVYDKDINLFRLYVDKSLNQEKMSSKQVVFKIATYFPKFFFPVFSIRNKIKNL